MGQVATTYSLSKNRDAMTISIVLSHAVKLPINHSAPEYPVKSLRLVHLMSVTMVTNYAVFQLFLSWFSFTDTLLNVSTLSISFIATNHVTL